MSELRLVAVVCLLGIIATVSFCEIRREQQAKTESSLPPIQETIPKAPPKAGPTQSEIVNNTPLIGIIGEPKYEEDFRDYNYPHELVYSVTYETTADHEVLEGQLHKYLESCEYTLEQAVPFKWYVPLDTTQPYEAGFSYWNANGKLFVEINHTRFCKEGTSLEAAREQF